MNDREMKEKQKELQEEIQRLTEEKRLLKEEQKYLNRLGKISGIKGYYSIPQMHKKFGIEYMYLRDRTEFSAKLRGKFWVYPVETIDANALAIKESLPPLCIKDYYTKVEVAEKLGVDPDSITIRMQLEFDGIDTGRNRYFPKKSVDEYLEAYSDVVMFKDIAEIVRDKYSVGKRRLATLLKMNDIEVLKNPINNSLYVKNTALPRIFVLCEDDNKEFTPYEKYERYKMQNPSSASIPETIKALDEFFYNRFRERARSPEDIIVSACQLYKFLTTHLLKELSKVKHEQLTLYMKIMNKDPNINKRTITEYTNLINYIHKKTIFTRDYAEEKSNTKKNEPYTQVEFLKLWNLIYNRIYEPELLSEILNNRHTAMSCLYIGMHYVTIWRSTDIRTLPFPDIERIGFYNGTDFFEWLKQGNEFTENMGIILCNDLKLKMEALRKKAEKNRKKLVFEFGHLQAKSLGFLLCICESYRRISIETNKGKIKKTSHLYVMTDRVTNPFEQSERFSTELNKILDDQNFTNRRANKAFSNYILTKSEEGKFGIGYFLTSVMRSHTLNEEMVASITQRYMNRNIDSAIEDIAMTLFDRGTMGFAKYQLLSMVNPEFPLLYSDEQTALIKGLSINNSDIEKTYKSVSDNRIIVNKMLTLAVQKPEHAKKVLFQLAYGRNCGESENTKCLLRAILSAGAFDLKDLDNHSEAFEGLSTEFACLRENCISCIGCPMLVMQTLFIVELSERILDVLNRFLRAESDFDRKMYSEMIYGGYMPILMEITAEFGKYRIESLMNMPEIRRMIGEVKKQERLRLTTAHDTGRRI